MISKSPLFNLQAVLKETTLKADVLRAWERRYGLPTPQRSSGGHRLYSEYDIATIKWLRARQAEGLSISHAVELWNEISGAGQDPLLESLQLTAAEEPAIQADINRIDMFRTNWLNACLNFDALIAEDIINQAFALYPVETVCFEILQKGIHEIGHLWYENKATVHQEHFASALAMRRIETLISATPQPTRDQTILVGCPAGEWHSFPVLLLTLLLRRKGLNVLYLGPNIPLEKMEETAALVRPDLIILSSQQLSTASAIHFAALLFQKLHIPLGYGGLVFNRIPELRGKIPAFFLGEKLEEGIDRIEQLLASPEPFPEGILLKGTDDEAAAVFRSKIPLIEATLMEILKEEGFSFEYMAEVNAYFTAELSAALELGDPRFLEPDLEWVNKLMMDRNLPPNLLSPYLAAYQHAVDLAMGESGRVITEWLASYVTKLSTSTQ